MNINRYMTKFDSIFEAAVNRFQQRGILEGDVVKLRKNWKKHEFFKDAGDNLMEKIEGLGQEGKRIRVSSINTNHSGMGMIRDGKIFVDIVEEEMPGLWYNPVTVPIDVLEFVANQNDSFQVPVQGQGKKESNTQDKYTKV